MTRTPNAASEDDLRLPAFIRLNINPIVAEWISFARTRTPASHTMTELALQDHIVEILNFIADDLETAQTAKQQVAKSKGLGPDHAPFAKSAAEIHATLRLADGFDIDQMVSEYRALRASVVKQWLARNQALAASDLEDLTRFNEAIDQAMTESVTQYTDAITRSRNLFLGILGHDLRNPIGAASMAAQVMVKMGEPNAKQTILASKIVDTTQRATKILNDLLDVTRSAFGTDIPIHRIPMDMGDLGRKLADEMQTLGDGREIGIEVVGDTAGHWDHGRMGQVFSNLLGNAIQYSPPGSPISVTVADENANVRISVHNDGEPIPPEKIDTLFDFLSRGYGSGLTDEHSTNLGLGLFIAKKIVAAHDGEIHVASDSHSGTVFTVIVPKSLN
ncbi:sensor histidine kinase [Terrihabitans rhizophilus]|uniref:histidine kinase n=1 Tax=Terrihabitans rhizophilus TaxID=3092662 RepID=A0ABU4RQB1_9HYPH|nr:sensor histidine kinase [Terrihabitans sp. PJ23]MDX6806289.1 sensor histidine kinase [Terrihabitans sp. PJ23]